MHLYQLNPTNDANEYQRVESLFKHSCSNHIVKIERLQDPALYRTYTIQKQRMDQANGSNEQWLFHETRGNYQSINHTGFNINSFGKYAGKENMIDYNLNCVNNKKLKKIGS